MNTSLGTGGLNNYTNDDDMNRQDNPTLQPDMTATHILPPVLIVLGTIGNILIIAVFRNLPYQSTSKLFLCTLAASDLLGLYVRLLPVWIWRIAGIDLQESGPFLCKTFEWLSTSVLDFSSWIIVAITIERVLATWFSAAKHICTQRIALVYLIVTGIILLVINSHFAYGFIYIEKIHEIDNGTFSNSCQQISENYLDFLYYTWPWIDLPKYSLIPFMVICVGNCLILFLVRQSHKRSREDRLERTATMRSASLIRGRKKISTLTVTLLLINTAFFISTFPISVFLTIRSISQRQYFEEYSMILLGDFLHDFMFVNNTFNICLYCLSGVKFRNGLFKLFSSLPRPPFFWTSLPGGERTTNPKHCMTPSTGFDTPMDSGGSKVRDYEQAKQRNTEDTKL